MKTLDRLRSTFSFGGDFEEFESCEPMSIALIVGNCIRVAPERHVVWEPELCQPRCLGVFIQGQCGPFSVRSTYPVGPGLNFLFFVIGVCFDPGGTWQSSNRPEIGVFVQRSTFFFPPHVVRLMFGRNVSRMWAKFISYCIIVRNAIGLWDR